MRHDSVLNSDVLVATWNSVADGDADESNCPSETTDDVGADADDDDGMSSGGSLELDRCTAPDITRNANPLRQQPPSLRSLQTRPGISLVILLTPSTPAVPNCCCLQGSAPYWSNPIFLIFDI